MERKIRFAQPNCAANRCVADVAPSAPLNDGAMTPESPIEQSDFDALLELLDRDTMREVVTMFAISAPERMTVARDGIVSGDARAVATAFHTMRSGCGQLGARYLEELCANAERSAKAGDLRDTAALTDLVALELERCLGWFREHSWVDS